MTTLEQEQKRAVPDRRSATAVLAAAGIAGPIVYSVVALVQSLLREDHSLLADPIAKLAIGSGAWVQHVNFVVLGILMIAYAIGLHRGLRPARWGVIGPAFLVLAGMGQVWAGLADPSRAPFLMTFLGAGIGLIVISRRMARDPRWQSLAAYALITGIAMLVALPAGVLLGIPPDATPRPWSGLASWVLAAVWFIGTVVLALRLLRVSRNADGDEAGIVRSGTTTRRQ